MDALRTNRPTLEALRQMPVSDVIAPPARPLQCSLSNDPPAFSTRAENSRPAGITSRARPAQDHSSFALALPDCSMNSRRILTRCRSKKRLASRIARKTKA